MMTPDDIEAERIERLAELDRENADDPGWREHFVLGSLGCHEALHTASVLQAVVEEHLASHPAVLLDPECFALASRASEALADLYQALGRRDSSP
jgi:hypothetical protein